MTSVAQNKFADRNVPNVLALVFRLGILAIRIFFLVSLFPL